MGVTGSPFCEHKKLRTACAICKASQGPAQALGQAQGATPYVSRDERDEKTQKRAAKADAREPVEKSHKLGGPGKPLMPKRPRKQRVTAQDEANAEAWWVKK